MHPGLLNLFALFAESWFANPVASLWLRSERDISPQKPTITAASTSSDARRPANQKITLTLSPLLHPTDKTHPP